MKQVEDRIKLMHLRAKQIKRKDDMIHTALYGVTSLVLLVFLIALTVLQGGTFHSIDSGQFTGTSLLDANVGGYVLVGVLSFAAAVAITLLCIRQKNKDRDKNEPKS